MSGATEQDKIVGEWIAAANTHDAGEFFAYFTEDAVLDDLSVGKVFTGHVSADLL